MARRLVSVELDLKARQYLDSGAKVLAETKAIKHEVNDLGDQADQAAHDVNGLGKQAGQAAGDMAALAAAAEAAKAGLAGFDDDSVKATSHTGLLKKAIADARAELQRLEQQLAKTGDLSLLKGISSQRGKVNRLDRVLQDLATPTTRVVNRGLSNALSGALSGLEIKPALIGSLVAVGVAAAPMIGAIIGGAVTGAAGVGGIVGGVLAAKDNPLVTSAWKGFGRDASLEFSKMGTFFVQPVVESIGILDNELKDLHLTETFRPAAGYVTVIAHGLATMVGGISSGFGAALANAGPVIHELAVDLGDFGQSFGQMLDEMSQGKGNAEGLRSAFALLDETMVVLGGTVETLSTGFHNFNATGSLVSHSLEEATRQSPLVAAGFGMIANVFDGLSAASHHVDVAIVGVNGHFLDAGSAASRMVNPFHAFDDAVKELARDVGNLVNKQLDDYIDKALGAKTATTDWAQEMLDLKTAVKEHGGSLNQATQAGIDNNRLLERGVQLAKDRRDEVFAETNDIGKANAAYDAMIAQLEKAAIKAGMNKKAVDEWAKSVKDLPNNVTTTLNVKLGRVPTLAEVASAAGANISGGTLVARTSTPHGFAPAHAAGGPNAPGWNLYGEYGPELHYNTSPGMTWNASQTASMLGGNRSITIIVKDTSGRTLHSELVDFSLGRGVDPAVVRAAYPL